MKIADKSLALELFYRDEIKYCVLIRMAEENRISRIIVDDSVSPNSFILFGNAAGRPSLYVDSCDTASFGRLGQYFPKGEFYVEMYRDDLAETLKPLGLNYRRFGTFNIMRALSEDFKPEESGKAIHYKPGLHREYLKNSRIWDGIPGIDTQSLIENIEKADSEWIVVEDGRVVSKCDVFKRTRNCYDMNEVVTETGFRRRGYAAQVVSAATNWVISKNKIPLYLADSSNIPSVNLAKSIGYKLAASYTGFLVTPQNR
jgi:hypothetical protein